METNNDKPMTRQDAVEHNARVLTTVPIEEWTQHLVPAPLLPRQERDDA